MEISYFWEGAPVLPGYMDLCIRSWERNVPGARVTRINHANLREMSEGRVDPAVIGRYSFAIQSDVVAAGVLAARGGLFLDADMILFRNFDVKGYSADLCTVYGDLATRRGCSLAFILAEQPGHPFVTAWLEELSGVIAGTRKRDLIYWKLRRLLTGKPARVPYGLLGTFIVDRQMNDPVLSRFAELRDHVERGTYPYIGMSGGVDGYNHESYRRLMFGAEDRSAQIMAQCRDGVLALQNSWHPADFQALSPEEVLAGRSTISRLLAAALEG